MPYVNDGVGYKGTDTSRDAAEQVAAMPAACVRARVLKAISGSGDGGLTADQVAQALGLSVLTVRPRVSELRTSGLIVDKRERRKNASGKSAVVWVAHAR